MQAWVPILQKKKKKIIIQSNNDLDFLRKQVTKIGYYITKEELVKDSKIIYTIIEFKKGFRLYNKKQLFFGPFLLKEKNSLFKEKYLKELKKIEQFYHRIPAKHYHHKLKTYFKLKMLKNILSD